MSLPTLAAVSCDSLVVIGEVGRGLDLSPNALGLIFPCTDLLILPTFRPNARQQALHDAYRTRYGALRNLCLVGYQTWEMTLGCVSKWWSDPACSRFIVEWHMGPVHTFVLKVDSGWAAPPATRQRKLEQAGRWFDYECKFRRSAE